MAPRRSRPAYEALNAHWLQGHTWADLGNAVYRDLKASIATYDFVKTDEERERIVIDALLEAGASLVTTGLRNLKHQRDRFTTSPRRRAQGRNRQKP
jgi:hypothetical protein